MVDSTSWNATFTGRHVIVTLSGVKHVTPDAAMGPDPESLDVRLAVRTVMLVKSKSLSETNFRR
jgi:hypothetical protein